MHCLNVQDKSLFHSIVLLFVSFQTCTPFIWQPYLSLNRLLASDMWSRIQPVTGQNMFKDSLQQHKIKEALPVTKKSFIVAYCFTVLHSLIKSENNVHFIFLFSLYFLILAQLHENNLGTSYSTIQYITQNVTGTRKCFDPLISVSMPAS